VSSIRYFVRVKDRDFEVELTENGDALSVKLDGREVEADLTPLAGHQLHSLLIDGQSRELVLEREGDRTFVSLDGERMEVQVQDELARALSAFGGQRPSGATVVTAPMPGVVVEVRVAPGDTIAAGQPVVVMEAMKMQNELGAEADGVVESVAVKPGDTVDGGTVLVVLTPAEPPAEAAG
jgi:biotin carboxyl carrier protein